MGLRLFLLCLALAASAACRPATKDTAAEPPAPAGTRTAALEASGSTPAAPTSAGGYDPAAHDFVGSERCRPCHASVFQEWKASSHATTVRPAEFADEELVETFIECGDLFFTHVLGDRHHVRFLIDDEEKAWGEGRVLALPCGWDVHEKEVTLHHPDKWKSLPWESGCAGCHVTGFRPEDHGFLEYGVGCEECHGPASGHVNTADRSAVLSFGGVPASVEATVCASCHLQGGRSVSTGLKLPPKHRAGGPLFDDYEFDWSELDQIGEDAKVLDLHQKINIRAMVRDGEEGLRCTSCHSLHSLKHDKHRELPKQDFCLLCHQDDMSLKEYSQSCNVCEF